jgi:hypothetical protein
MDVKERTNDAGPSGVLATIQVPIPQDMSLSTPNRFAPLTRRMPAANSGLINPVSAASYAKRRTAANLALIVEGARFFCSRKRYLRTTARLNDSRGSEQYQPMNSSIACSYDSWELAAASEFRTARFDCSRSRSRSTVFPLRCLSSFGNAPYWRPPTPLIQYGDANAVSRDLDKSLRRFGRNSAVWHNRRPRGGSHTRRPETLSARTRSSCARND